MKMEEMIAPQKTIAADTWAACAAFPVGEGVLVGAVDVPDLLVEDPETEVVVGTAPDIVASAA